MYTKKTTMIEEHFDIICTNVPLMVRLLEYAREDVQKDVDLHFMAEKLVKLCNAGKILTMDDYEYIVGKENGD